MRRILKFLGFFWVATASCFLAYLLAELLVLHAPELLLAAFSGAQLEEFQLQARFPHFLPLPSAPLLDGASLWQAILSRGGFLFFGAAGLAAGLLAARRRGRWMRLLAAQAMFWTAVFLVFYSGLLIGWRGRLPALLSLLWPGTPGALVTAAGIAVLALALVSTYSGMRSALDALADTRPTRLALLAGGFLLPACIVAELLIGYLFSWGVLWEIRFAPWVLLWIAAHVLVPGIPAALRRSQQVHGLQTSLRQAIALPVTAALLFGLLLGKEDLARFLRQRQLRAQTTQYWLLHFDETALSQIDPVTFAAQADQRLAAMAERLGVEPPHPRLHAYVYASAEAKAAMVGSDQPFSLAGSRTEVHHLLAPSGELTDARGDALLLMQSAWGDPGSEAVARGLARYAAGDFYGYPLADYAARITREEEAYTLRDVFQLDTMYLSPLVCDALAGAWVQFQVKERGAGILPALYRAPLEAGQEETFAGALGTSWEELEREWREHLLALAEKTAPPEPRPPPAPFFHRGITLAHEFGGYWGYGTERARQQLVRLHDLGANGVAIVPYAATRAPREPRFNFYLAESDDRVIRTLEQAHQLGLRVMLKPQLYARVFTGDIVFENEEDFDRWFAQYRRWVLHFARLADLHRVDLLVIGTELSGVTHREAAWRGLIADLRRVYSGPLTYAAHWGEDFETLPFWDALDFLGVNMYYPLAEPGEILRADSETVRALGEKLEEMARRYGKPVLFTEVGYPANQSAAVQPWSEQDARLNPELQARCYQVVFEAFYQKPWLAGLYWWKWPSHGQPRPYSVEYSPLGKPAAGLLARWYGPLAREEIAQTPSKRVCSSK
ncbi:hypothetical protein MYX77_05625 [Acidobacteriia bacterium AH_259_A11_L15]|nr:hypothetical protein [Acidobacteriia bacterium AH_259_A11_L15]